MGLGDWWRRFRQREDERTIERSEERVDETLDERRFASGDVTGLKADELAARTFSEGDIEDAERFAGRRRPV